MNPSSRANRAFVAVLALALLGAAPTKHQRLASLAARRQLPPGPMKYLVTPAGHTFRVLGMVPLTDAGGKKLATMVSYEGDTRDVATAAAAAADLMDALGLELQTMNETEVVFQARVGFDPRKSLDSATAFHVTFELKDGRWTPLPFPRRPTTIGTGPLEVVDDPGFPFDGKGLTEAGQVAGRWMAMLDAGDASGLRQEMSASFASQVDSRKAEWERFVAERAVSRGTAPRRELYRLQTRNGGNALPGGRGVLVLYDVHYKGAPRSFEQVALAREDGRWRVWTIASQPLRK